MLNILAIRDRLVNGFVGYKCHFGAKLECFCQLKKRTSETLELVAFMERNASEIEGIFFDESILG